MALTGTTEEFDRHYRTVGEAVMRRIELEVIGADYGASSYTTVAEANRLSELLSLRPGMLLLDIGCGTGWPGIYLAGRNGSQVLMTDLAMDGLDAARRRLANDGVEGAVVGAAGDLLPFRDGSIDAVTSSDVLCWLQDKLSVLRASNRVLKPGGVLSFFVISLPEGNTPDRPRGPFDFGPDWPDAGAGYGSLMAQAGFAESEVVDVTGDYEVTLKGWIRGWEAEAEALRALLGAEEVMERQARRHRSLAAIREGLLRRYLVTAVKSTAP